MRLVPSAVLFVVLAIASAAHAQTSPQLREIIGRYTALSQEMDPIRAAQRGDAAAAVRWPDDTQAAVERRRTELAAIAAQLSALDAGALSASDALERDALAYRVSIQREAYAFDEERMPFISGEGFFINPDYAASVTVLRNEAEAEAWLARMAAIPGYFDVEIANMRRGMAARFTQPRLVVMNSLRSVQAQAALPDAESPLLTPLARLPATMSQATRERLQARGAEIYAGQVKPALQGLAAFLEREYLPRARAQIGARSLPNGRAYYAYVVRRHTTTEMTPDEVHQLGLREVARVRREMDGVIAESGFQGTFAEFLAFLRTDRQFYPRDAEELMRISSEIANRANFHMPRFFGTLPRNTMAVTFIPSALEGGSAGYWPGNPLRGSAGQVLLRRTGAEERTLYDLPAWVMHEGSPGHHTQIAIGEELTDIPAYRRNDDVTAYVEGWALYAERLGGEMGIYRTPYERFGQLSMEMWRACRLVIDTGMHWRGWTREQAVACLRDNSALSPSQVEHEVDRYIGWPGQALAYKIGEIQIRDLRARAEERLGACFDLRAFHDALLGSGALPLAVLTRRMNAWIDARAAAGCAAR
ncbi:MAG: DUF885 domain-containing protein [Hyphomonadaceae bacterium]|nr:DUF885 domain-containing protein [Hyphomonadaceae bacterium]